MVLPDIDIGVIQETKILIHVIIFLNNGGFRRAAGKNGFLEQSISTYKNLSRF